jgi:hypothetical protein
MISEFEIEPSEDLLPKIIKRIHKEERILALRKLFIFSGTFIASIISLIPAFKLLLSDVNRSGFLNFFSLMFSDFSSIINYWPSFGMILLETLPALSLAIFLAVLLTFLQSLISITKNAKVVIHNNHLIAQ